MTQTIFQTVEELKLAKSRKFWIRVAIIAGICVLALAVYIVWPSKTPKVDEHLLNKVTRERDSAFGLIEEDRIQDNRKYDSLQTIIKLSEIEIQDIKNRRARIITYYIDTASRAEKLRYIDSLLGPE